jgi:hypothetical protein
LSPQVSIAIEIMIITFISFEQSVLR